MVEEKMGNRIEDIEDKVNKTEEKSLNQNVSVNIDKFIYVRTQYI